MPQQARVLTHVGLVVPDIRAAVEWYSSVLGFVALAPPVLLSADSHAGRVAAAIYGERFGSCKQAQLMAGNGVAVVPAPNLLAGTIPAYSSGQSAAAATGDDIVVVVATTVGIDVLGFRG